jgi:hypothetical protein
MTLQPVEARALAHAAGAARQLTFSGRITLTAEH